jgi:hypothetical protein
MFGKNHEVIAIAIKIFDGCGPGVTGAEVESACGFIRRQARGLNKDQPPAEFANFFLCGGQQAAAYAVVMQGGIYGKPVQVKSAVCQRARTVTGKAEHATVLVSGYQSVVTGAFRTVNLVFLPEFVHAFDFFGAENGNMRSNVVYLISIVGCGKSNHLIHPSRCRALEMILSIIWG